LVLLSVAGLAVLSALWFELLRYARTQLF